MGTSVPGMVTQAGAQGVRIISRRRLREFAEEHADAERPLNAWYGIVRGRWYRTPNELKADFPNASFLGHWRTVFNIGGNKYRLIADLRYDLQRVYVRDVLTHEEYDRRSREGTL
jgi:mRNA interferase HigB